VFHGVPPVPNVSDVPNVPLIKMEHPITGYASSTQENEMADEKLCRQQLKKCKAILTEITG
jgi:hypothetical protein